MTSYLWCYCLCSIDLPIFFYVSPSYTDLHEHFNLYTPGWLFGINLSLFLHKIFYQLGPVWNTTLNPNFCISFIFGPIFGIQGKVIVCLLSVLLLLLLLMLRVFFSRLLIRFYIFRSCRFSLNISGRYSISVLKYFSEQILVALGRNHLNILWLY